MMQRSVKPVAVPPFGMSQTSIVFFVFSLLFFVANASAFGFPLTFVVSIAAMVLLAIGQTLVVKRHHMILTLVYFSIVLGMLDLDVFFASYDDYWLWPALMIASMPVLYIFRLYQSLALRDGVVGAVIMFCLLAPFFQNENQVTALFGANILYRIVLFWYCLIGWLALRRNNWAAFFIAVAVGYWLIQLVDSRAGQILYFGSTALLVAHKLIAGTRYLVVPATLTVVGMSLLNLQQAFGLLGYFGINLSVFNASEAYRLQLMQSLLRPEIVLDQKLTIQEIYTFSGSYPHSILVEAFAYNGIFFGVMTLFVVLYAIIKVVSRPEYMFLLGIVVGPLFSGDMRDNYPVFLIVIFFLLSDLDKMLRKRSPEVAG